MLMVFALAAALLSAAFALTMFEAFGKQEPVLARAKSTRR